MKPGTEAALVIGGAFLAVIAVAYFVKQKKAAQSPIATQAASIVDYGTSSYTYGGQYGVVVPSSYLSGGISLGASPQVVTVGTVPGYNGFLQSTGVYYRVVNGQTVGYEKGLTSAIGSPSRAGVEILPATGVAPPGGTLGGTGSYTGTLDNPATFMPASGITNAGGTTSSGLSNVVVSQPTYSNNASVTNSGSVTSTGTT